nr:MAG TPA: hypothetical protein [Caudoviricetes sp.]
MGTYQVIPYLHTMKVWVNKKKQGDERLCNY